MTDLLQARTSSPLRGGPSFSLQHRLRRLAWNVAWALLASWTPPPLRAWRRFLLRQFGAHLAPTANVYGSARIWYPPNLVMAEHATIGPGAQVYCMDRIELGPYALISQGAFLCGGTHDVEDPHFQLKTRPIRIGAHAWIAAEAFVGPGVTVGQGAVLGARAVAVRDLDAWAIYVGNPAHRVKRRPKFS